MANADKHGALVGCYKHTGDLTEVRCLQEAPCSVSDGVSAQYLVVAESIADACPVIRHNLAIGSGGLYP